MDTARMVTYLKVTMLLFILIAGIYVFTWLIEFTKWFASAAELMQSCHSILDISPMPLPGLVCSQELVYLGLMAQFFAVSIIVSLYLWHLAKKHYFSAFPQVEDKGTKAQRSRKKVPIK